MRSPIYASPASIARSSPWRTSSVRSRRCAPPGSPRVSRPGTPSSTESTLRQRTNREGHVGAACAADPEGAMELAGDSTAQKAATRNGRKAKPDRKGLRIERVWTKPGVHPYDEVTWERRDVVMTNWRDGSINFEQRGVEFPDFWSINASN